MPTPRNRHTSIPCLILMLLFFGLGEQRSEAQITTTRLNDNQPIITKKMPIRDSNMNGPSMVRIPSWIPASEKADPDAQYYLYFASHWGRHIKMAWSSNIEGPYTIFNPGKGVFDLDTYSCPGNLTLNNHIASPDILIDNKNKKFIMYFHTGNAIWNGDTIDKQKTVVATSSFGLDFNDGLEDVVICPFYARVFEYNKHLYALTKEGLYMASDLFFPWKHKQIFSKLNPHLWRHVAEPFSAVPLDERHFAVLKDASNLHVMYSRISTSPEHIEYSTIALQNFEKLWKVTEPVDILYPEYDWEGVNYPKEPSEIGLKKDVNELRDPDLFRDKDGQIYLLYTGAGESEIGIARIEGLTTSKEFPCANSINIFPNPTDGELINITGIDRNVHIEVFTGIGKLVFSEDIEECDIYQIDIREFPKGLLTISIEECTYLLINPI